MTRLAKISRVVISVAFIAAFLTVGHRAYLQAQEPAQDARAAGLARLVETKSCAGCDLAGLTFTDAMKLRGVDLAGAKLASASFYRDDLTNANFSDADLTKAVLSFANLTNANFGGANLDGANLAGSTGANIIGATTTEATVCPDGQHGPCR